MTDTPARCARASAARTFPPLPGLVHLTDPDSPAPRTTFLESPSTSGYRVPNPSAAEQVASTRWATARFKVQREPGQPRPWNWSCRPLSLDHWPSVSATLASSWTRNWTMVGPTDDRCLRALVGIA
jgi:hypothetical protein